MSVSIHQSTLRNISEDLTRISIVNKTSSLTLVEQISTLGLSFKTKNRRLQNDRENGAVVPVINYAQRQ
jgi:hypothetical protein